LLHCEEVGSINSSGKGQRNSPVGWQYKRNENAAAKLEA
jgi:hypothetical protein